MQNIVFASIIHFTEQSSVPFILCFKKMYLHFSMLNNFIEKLFFFNYILFFQLLTGLKASFFCWSLICLGIHLAEVLLYCILFWIILQKVPILACTSPVICSMAIYPLSWINMLMWYSREEAVTSTSHPIPCSSKMLIMPVLNCSAH